MPFARTIDFISKIFLCYDIVSMCAGTFLGRPVTFPTIHITLVFLQVDLDKLAYI